MYTLLGNKLGLTVVKKLWPKRTSKNKLKAELIKIREDHKEYRKWQDMRLMENN